MRASPAERGGRKDVSAPRSVSVTEPGQRTGTMLNAEALRLAVQVLDNLHAQIRATDENIRALFAGSAIFVAAVTLTRQQVLSQLQSKEQRTLILIAYVVLLATLAFSLISGVLTLRQRLLTHHPVAERSLFYFGDIHGMETADYVRAFMGLSVEAALDQVLTQVHVNAKICRRSTCGRGPLPPVSSPPPWCGWRYGLRTGSPDAHARAGR